MLTCYSQQEKHGILLQDHLGNTHVLLLMVFIILLPCQMTGIVSSMRLSICHLWFWECKVKPREKEKETKVVQI